MTSVQAYERYRSSGLQWIPEIPDHWRVVPSWAIARQIRRPPLAGEGIVTAFRDGQVTLRTKRRTDGFTEAIQEHGYQGVRRGELVIHSMDGFAGAIGVSDSEGKMSPVAHIYSVRDGEPRYFAHLLRVMALGGFVESLAKGIRERSTAFDRATFKSLSLPVPPIEEQRRILVYLDREMAQIDAFIAKNEHLIALLAERRAAVVSTAMDQGFPEVAVRHTVRLIQTGPFGSQLHAEDYVSGGHPLINPMHMIGGRAVPSEDVAISNEKASELRRHELRSDDLVVARRGELGRSALITGDDVGFLCGTGSMLVRPDGRRVVARYLQLAIGSERSRAMLREQSVGSTMENLNGSVLSALRIPLPPVEVQREILHDVDAANVRIDRALATARRCILLARERRAALISDAVTGKIDVREAA